MFSNAYRMACTGDPAMEEAAHQADPQNDLLWHFDLRRLTAEEVRDSVLAVNGTLNLTMFGPSIYPPIPKEVLASESVPGRGWGMRAPEEALVGASIFTSSGRCTCRSSRALDMAETDKSCPVRFVTVQPTQALTMLNGAFMNEEAQKFACATS